MNNLSEERSISARAQIEALLQQLAKAHADRDVDAIIEAYAPGARIFDLAPPLARRGPQRDEVEAWLATWEGPIGLEHRDLCQTVGDGLAFVSMLNRILGQQGGVTQDLWFRTTLCLQRLEGRWRIVCDHSSVPFYMDGSYRAAVDLTP